MTSVFLHARLRLLVLMLAAIVLIGVGCGGSDDEGDSAVPGDLAPAEIDVPTVAPPSLRAGDCFRSPEDLALAENKVACGEAHNYEVFSFDEVAAADFPGSTELDAQAAALCEENFQAAKGAASAMSLVETLWAVPTESTWSAGDRYIACAIKYPTDTALTFLEFDPLRAFGLISIFGFQEGDCFSAIDLERTGARPISCDAPHQFEVYATKQLPDGEFPGEAVVTGEQNRFCGDELTSFLGGSVAIGNPQALFPDDRTWNELNDRQISCLLVTDPMVEGTLRGTGAPGQPAPAGDQPDDGPDSALDGVETDLFGGDVSVGNWISTETMTSSEISLSWAGVADATSYELFRIDQSAAIGDDPATWNGAESIYSGPELAWVDQSVTAGASYVYFITATGADFTTNAQWRAAAAVDDTTPPNPVGSVSALRVGDGLLLQWNESGDDFRFAVYEVFRGLGGGEPEYYDTVWSQDETAYVDTSPPAAGDVIYQIVAIDLHGNESERSSLTYSFG